MDNHNNIVRVVRNDPSLQRDVGTLAQEAAAGGSTKAGAVFNEGDEMIFMGGEQDGYVQVESGKGGGWVKKILVTK